MVSVNLPFPWPQGLSQILRSVASLVLSLRCESFLQSLTNIPWLWALKAVHDPTTGGANDRGLQYQSSQRTASLIIRARYHDAALAPPVLIKTKKQLSFRHKPLTAITPSAFIIASSSSHSKSMAGARSLSQKDLQLPWVELTLL